MFNFFNLVKFDLLSLISSSKTAYVNFDPTLNTLIITKLKSCQNYNVDFIALLLLKIFRKLNVNVKSKRNLPGWQKLADLYQLCDEKVEENLISTNARSLKLINKKKAKCDTNNDTINSADVEGMSKKSGLGISSKYQYNNYSGHFKIIII